PRPGRPHPSRRAHRARFCASHPLTGMSTWSCSVAGGSTLENKYVRKTERKSAKPRSPLKRSIPEFPTKVGGHHMSGSTDPARDSSLKDREGSGGIWVLTHDAACRRQCNTAA